MILKRAFPSLIPFVRFLRSAFAATLDWFRRKIFHANYSHRIFTKIYETKHWGGHASVSGVGSTLESTEAIRLEFPSLLRRLDVRTLVDAPCGDFLWMHEIECDLPTYVGLDVVPQLIANNKAQFSNSKIRFAVADITRTHFRRVMLCFAGTA
jgi:hypothetical protein